jgi:hypothetical protein
MLSVTCKPFILSVVMLSVVMLNVVAPSELMHQHHNSIMLQSLCLHSQNVL